MVSSMKVKFKEEVYTLKVHPVQAGYVIQKSGSKAVQVDKLQLGLVKGNLMLNIIKGASSWQRQVLGISFKK